MLVAIAIFGGNSEWSHVAVIIVFLLFVGPSLLATVVVAMLPPRSRRAGPRRSPILSSSVGRLLENGLAAAAGIGCIVGINMYFYAPESGLGYLGRLLMWLMLTPAICATVLHFVRAQLDTPGLARGDSDRYSSSRAVCARIPV